MHCKAKQGGKQRLCWTSCAAAQAPWRPQRQCLGGAPSAERHEDEAHARKTLKNTPSKCAPCPALSHLPPGHRQGASGLWHNRARLCKRCCNVKNWHSTGAEALAVPEAAPQSRKQRLRVPRKDAVSFNPETPNLLSECSPMRRASWWTT